MIKGRKKENIIIIFAVTFITVAALFALSVLKTDAYNRTRHRSYFSGSRLFTEEPDKTEAMSVTAVPRGSTWTKAFDLNNEGLTEHNYQA